MGRQANTLAAQQMQHGSTCTRLEEKLKDEQVQHVSTCSKNWPQLYPIPRGFNSWEKGTIVPFNFTLWYIPVTYTEGKSTSPESFTLPLSSSNTRWSSGCIKLCGLTRGVADLCTFHLNVSVQSQNTKTIEKSCK